MNFERRLAMTRFQMELSGQLGDYWKRNAEEEIAWMQERVDNGDVLIDENCAAYWKSSGNYIPEDCVEKLELTGFFFDADATNKAREQQDAEFLKEYCLQKHEPTEEELCEIRAAFGAGATIVNVISGDTYVV